MTNQEAAADTFLPFCGFYCSISKSKSGTWGMWDVDVFEQLKEKQK